MIRLNTPFLRDGFFPDGFAEGEFFKSLLPPNATVQEQWMEYATSRIGSVPVPIRETWNPDTCPADKLAFLAWAFGVDEWDPSWSDDSKRATIRDAVLVQSRKGSVWSMRRALENAGYGTATITEGKYGYRRDGSAVRDGSIKHGDLTEWAQYSVVLDRPISNEQAAQVRRILEITAPARCRLKALSYTQANNLHNGKITRNGTFNRGTA